MVAGNWREVTEENDTGRVPMQEREKRGKHKTKVMVEYVLIAGINDSHEVALEVGALLKGMRILFGAAYG